MTTTTTTEEELPTTTTTTEEEVEESVLIADFEELYGIGPLVVDFEERYSLATYIISDFEELYWLNREIIKDYSETYDILNHNIIEKDFEELYILKGLDVETINNTIIVIVAGQRIQPVDLFINYEKGSYCMAFSMSLVDFETYSLCAKGLEVKITINGRPFKFIIDTLSREREFGVTSWLVNGRSKTSMLNSIDTETIKKTWGATTAKTIIQELCDDVGITLIWNIANWAIGTGLVSADDVKPLEIITIIAEATGAEILTNEIGDLIIQYKYLVSPSLHENASADLILNDIKDINRIGESKELRDGYNSVLISNKDVQEGVEDYIDIQLDELKNNGRTIFTSSDTVVYVRIFSNIDYTPILTAGSISKIESNHILKLEPEDVSFVHNEFGTVSNPVNSLISAIWYGTDLGSISVVDGKPTTVQASGQTESSIGIAKIVYNTKYDIWRITPPSGIVDSFKIFILSAHDYED